MQVMLYEEVIGAQQDTSTLSIQTLELQTWHLCSLNAHLIRFTEFIPFPLPNTQGRSWAFRMMYTSGNMKSSMIITL